MEKFLYKQVIEEHEIEYEVIPTGDLQATEQEIDEQILTNLKRIDELSEGIKELTVDADEWDYAISACSGVLAGMIDVLFVGELSFREINLAEAQSLGKETVEKWIRTAAKVKGYSGESILGQVEKLEESSLASDKATNEFGGGNWHHFNDFAHHSFPFGLFWSIVTQITKKAYGTDKYGKWVAPVDLTNCKDVKLAENPYEVIVYGVIDWVFHMLSDMNGSSSSIRKESIDLGIPGTGIPGPIMSFLKELSVLPIFKRESNHGYKAINTRLKKAFMDNKIDLRTEIGICHQVELNVLEASKQFVPVLVNECIVRTFFFIKKFCIQIKQNNIQTIEELDMLDWKNILPFNNATLSRMLLVSTGVMEAIDLTEAAVAGGIEAAKHGVKGAAKGAAAGPYGAVAGASAEAVTAFFKTFALHVNYVGIGRFVIVFGSELTFDYKRNKLIKERIEVYDSVLGLTNAKLLCRESSVWISAEEAGKVIVENCQMLEEAKREFLDSMISINNSLDNIEEHIDKLDEKDKDAKEDMMRALKWGDTDMDNLFEINIDEFDVKQVPSLIENQFKEMEELHNRIIKAKSKALQTQQVVYEKAGNTKGGTKTAITGLQEASFYMANAQIDAMEAQEVSFRFQQKLGEVTKFLLRLGTSNIAVNRAIVSEIEAKLEGYSTEEFGEATKNELEDLLASLKSQQDVDMRQRELAIIVKEHDELIQSLLLEIKELREELAEKNRE